MKFARFWIWFAALANFAGWSLSAFGQLNRAGYAIFLAATAAVFFLCRKYFSDPPAGRIPNRAKILRRFRRPLPLAFAALAFLVFLGGALYPPSNYTGLNYHLARVLQWLAQGQWCWIHTAIVRMNYSGCVFEWLTTPVVLFTHSDRAIFLVNFLPFLLLPGLIFSVFTRLGVAARVAWWWMWLLPTGYIFLLQSGSIGNDAFSVAFALAAMDFGCRARESRGRSDLWTSLLAVALLTGTKPTSLPLLLPWAVLVFPLWRLVLGDWLPTLPVAILAAFASFLPLATMNQIHSGDWLGRTIESLPKDIHNPLIGILGNAFQILLNNFVPPLFPLAGWWNNHAEAFAPSGIVQAFNANFDYPLFTLGELPTEDCTGLGCGLCLLLVASVLGGFWLRGRARQTPVRRPIPVWHGRWVLIAGWVSLLVYSIKSGIGTGARLIAPYYLLLLPALLLGVGQSLVVRRRWWRWLTGAVLFLALVVLVLSPDRPLWPAQTILSKLVAQHPQQPTLARALKVYTAYAQRNDALAGVRALLPPDLKMVGFIGDADDCDISLWRPFGSRRVEHFLLTDPPGQIRKWVQYVVLGGFNLQMHGQTIDHWRQAANAELVGTTNVTLKIAEGSQPWYVVKFKPE